MPKLAGALPEHLPSEPIIIMLDDFGFFLNFFMLDDFELTDWFGCFVILTFTLSEKEKEREHRPPLIFIDYLYVLTREVDIKPTDLNYIRRFDYFHK